MPESQNKECVWAFGMLKQNIYMNLSDSEQILSKQKDAYFLS